MSIIPGIENLAPERTERSRGAGPAPKLRPLVFSRRATASSTSGQRSSGISPVAMATRQTSVVIVNPGGNREPE